MNPHLTFSLTKGFLCLFICFFLPCGAVFADDLSSLNDCVGIVTRAVVCGNAFSVLVHVGSRGTAAALHLYGVGAGVVVLPEEAAGALTASHFI